MQFNKPKIIFGCFQPIGALLCCIELNTGVQLIALFQLIAGVGYLVLSIRDLVWYSNSNLEDHRHKLHIFESSLNMIISIYDIIMGICGILARNRLSRADLYAKMWKIYYRIVMICSCSILGSTIARIILETHSNIGIFLALLLFGGYIGFITHLLVVVLSWHQQLHSIQSYQENSSISDNHTQIIVAPAGKLQYLEMEPQATIQRGIPTN